MQTRMEEGKDVPLFKFIRELDKNVEKFTYTKTGASSDDEIDAISGATITTNAMTNGVNAGLCAFRYVEGGAES